MAIGQLCNDLQVCNFTVIADPEVGERHISTKYSKCNHFKVTTDLLNSENMKVGTAQLHHELQVYNFTMF